MRRLAGLLCAIVLSLGPISPLAAAPGWSDPSPHHHGFVRANGVRLEYLDWGGPGRALILIPGLGENPHVFDDLASAFVAQFRVIAYARRSHGGSETRAPYDTATLTEDLRGLMDALGIVNADLVGWSMGGNEITTMAINHPERVGRLVYLDAAYDWADPDLKVALDAFPANLRSVPAGAMTSFDAYRAYQKSENYPARFDMRRVEAYLRASVTTQDEGGLTNAMPKAVEEALYASLSSNPPLQYAKVRCPALAIYATSTVNLHDPDLIRRADAIAWESHFMGPFRTKSMERVRHEMPNVQIMRVEGRHGSFFLTARNQVVRAMRNFLENGVSAPRSP